MHPKEYILDFAFMVFLWLNELKTLSEMPPLSLMPNLLMDSTANGPISPGRIVPNLDIQFQPLENILRTVFIPTITGRPPPNDTDRDVFALPTRSRCGGLGLSNPAKQCDPQFSASHSISKPLIESILLQNPAGCFRGARSRTIILFN